MPGSDDQYDQVHTYSQAHAGKSKTATPAPREVGRDGAAVELFIGEGITAGNVRTPPSGVAYLFVDSNGALRHRNADGTDDLRLPTGQAIEDGSGTQRLSLNSASTALRGDQGTVRVRANDGTSLRLEADGSTPIVFRDTQFSGIAVQYVSSASAPGTLELPNAVIAASNGDQLINNSRGAALTAADSSTVDTTYGTAERDVIRNLRTRVNELEDRLQTHGLID